MESLLIISWTGGRAASYGRWNNQRRRNFRRSITVDRTDSSPSETLARPPADYASNSYHAAGPDLKLLVEAANLRGDERVLDCGTGAGHTALALAPRAAEVVGVDVAEEMLGEARDLARQRSLSNVRFEAADASALPYPEATFDVVSNRQSAHHYADLSRALDETRRVLKPGGRFLLIDTVTPADAGLDTFLNCVELLRDASHVRDNRASEWVRMLETRGFSVTIHTASRSPSTAMIGRNGCARPKRRSP